MGHTHKWRKVWNRVLTGTGDHRVEGVEIGRAFVCDCGSRKWWTFDHVRPDEAFQ